jgi:hypothetical protein
MKKIKSGKKPKPNRLKKTETGKNHGKKIKKESRNGRKSK